MASFIHEQLMQNKELWDQFIFKNVDTNNDISDSNGYGQFYSEPYMSKYLFEKGFHLEFPDSKKFAVCLTHDVDEIYPPITRSLLSLIGGVRSINHRGLKQDIYWRIKGKNHSPYINFKYIMDIEKKYGSTSSFYFLATDKDIKRFRYDIEDIENEIGEIIDNGHEVGLHGGYYTFDRPEEMKREKHRLEKTLNKRIIGYRNHYLNFKIPDSWEYLANAGFKYDTTIGHARAVGYKNGLCHPFLPFNIAKNTEIGILEIPIVAADFTLFNEYHSWVKPREYMKKLIDGVEKYNGVATLLWHNDDFNSILKNNWEKLYHKVLEYCHKKNAWLVSCDELYAWYVKFYI